MGSCKCEASEAGCGEEDASDTHSGSVVRNFVMGGFLEEEVRVMALRKSGKLRALRPREFKVAGGSF